MSDVDVIVIGRAGIADLSPALRKAEERLGREVNVTAYAPQEFREKIKSREHFLAAVTLTSFQKLFPPSQLFRKPVGESEMRATTPSPTLRRKRKRRGSWKKSAIHKTITLFPSQLERRGTPGSGA
jgi:hypothetical protein